VGAELAPLGVVFMQMLLESADVGTAATLADLAAWSRPNLRVGIGDVGVFFDASAVPLNAEVDARTLLTLAQSVGFAQTQDAEIRALIP
jgi:hypothetical protein